MISVGLASLANQTTLKFVDACIFTLLLVILEPIALLCRKKKGSFWDHSGTLRPGSCIFGGPFGGYSGTRDQGGEIRYHPVNSGTVEGYEDVATIKIATTAILL